MTQTRSHPLEGILVIALEQEVAAPFTSSRLADAGARVIKIERPEGGDFARRDDTAVDGESAYFVWLNRGKESVELGIKNPSGRNVLETMLTSADVFIQNLAPGALKKLGLDSDSLLQRFPRLITCDITGYGAGGPMKDAKTYDLLVQCESGLASITGTPDGPGRGFSLRYRNRHDRPCRYLRGIGGTRPDRARTRGIGRNVRHNGRLDDHAAAVSGAPRSPDTARGVKPPGHQPYGAYRCGDGEQIVVAAQTDAEWRRFCAEVLGNPELADDPRFHDNQSRASNRTTLNAIIETAFATQSRAEMSEILDRAGIAHGAVNDIAALLHHPQLDRAIVATPSGEVSLPAPPIRRSGEAPTLGPSPAFGEHTQAIINEFCGLADNDRKAGQDE